MEIIVIWRSNLNLFALKIVFDFNNDWNKNVIQLLTLFWRVYISHYRQNDINFMNSIMDRGTLRNSGKRKFWLRIPHETSLKPLVTQFT